MNRVESQLNSHINIGKNTALSQEKNKHDQMMMFNKI